MDEPPVARGTTPPSARTSPRIPSYDYATPGTYFVTACATAGHLRFGNVDNGEVRLNETGKVVAQCWEDIPAHFQTVVLDSYVVMPNHLHGLITLTDALDESPQDHARPSLNTIVGSFKSAATRRVNVLRNTPGAKLWQRTYYDHAIRTESGLARIREYITDNPAKWELDEENPDGIRPQG